MTDEQFNLYINARREYRRVCADIESVKSERCVLDNLLREGSLPPQLNPWKRLLVFLGIVRRPMTRISGKRLQEIEDRLSYLDEVYERADAVRVGLASRLLDYKPSPMESRLVDFSDTAERLQEQIDAQGRLLNTLLK